MTASGGCACGGVRYRVDGPLREVFNCHCERCRRITGHHFAATAADTADVTVGPADTLRWYAPVVGVEYGFCGTCGSTLFWRVAATPERLSITAGTLDQPTGLRTTTAWWVTQAGDYHERPDLTEFEYEG